MPNNRARPPLGSLLGHKAKPRRELTPILEGASVTDRGDQRCRRHRVDPFDLAETLADLAVAIELSDLSVVTGSLRNCSADWTASSNRYPRRASSHREAGYSVASESCPTGGGGGLRKGGHNSLKVRFLDHS